MKVPFLDLKVRHAALIMPKSRLQGARFPIAESLAEQFLSLPMFPELTTEHVDYVAWCVGEAVGERALA